MSSSIATRAKSTGFILGSAIALGSVAFVAPSTVRADSLNTDLGAASGFAVFALNAFSVTGGSTAINGNVAAGGSYSSSSPPINGTVFLNTGVKSQGGATGGFVTTDLTQAIADAKSAAARIAGFTPTQTLGAINGGTTFTGNGGQDVIDVPSINSSNGTLTFSGSASDIFVVNVAGDFSTSNTGMALTGGVTANHILFNIGGNFTITGGGGNNYYGTILDPNGNITIHDKTFGGEYIGNNVTITSNPTINNVPFVPLPKPLMASAALLGVIGLAGAARSRRVKLA